MNKNFKIIILIFIVVVFIFILIFLFRDKTVTNIINNNTLNRVSKISSSDNYLVNVDAMISDLKKSEFKKYKGEIENTDSITYIFLDKDNNILFKYIEIKNNNIVIFDINKEKLYYIKKGVLN